MSFTDAIKNAQGWKSLKKNPEPILIRTKDGRTYREDIGSEDGQIKIVGEVKDYDFVPIESAPDPEGTNTILRNC